jgi:hypothetical protein
VVSHQASRAGVSPAPTLARALTELLVGLDLVLLLLHLTAPVPLLLRGVTGPVIAAALGTADESLLGLMAPGQYAAAALFLVAQARARGSPGLWRAAAAATLLSLGDLLSLPASLGGSAAALLGLSPCLGLMPAQLGKLVVGGTLAALLGVLAGAPARSADAEARAVGRVLLLATVALAAIDLLLDLPGVWLGPGVLSGLLLDPLEEFAEAMTATVALTALVRRLSSPWDDGARAQTRGLMERTLRRPSRAPVG